MILVSHIYMGVIVPLAIVLPLTAAVVQYKGLPEACKILTWYLLMAGVTNLIAKMLAMQRINNLPVLHIYTLVEFAILSMFYRSVFKGSEVRKWILPVLSLFFCFCVVSAIFFQTIFIYNSYSRSVSAIIMMIYSIAYFKNALDRDDLPSMDFSPLLWINAALLVYFGGAVFLFASSNLIQSNLVMNIIFWNIHASLVLIMYILFTIGLLHAKRN